MCINVELGQENTVFKALCPAELLEIIENPNINYQNYITVVNVFNQLGFEELVYNFLSSKLQDLYDRTEKLRKLSSNIGTANNLEVQSKDYDKKPLIKIFIDNIKSESLNDLFSKKVDYIY